ncbi:VOC family protein [Accumulibacter sp.]|uniref:VOC family protein n=1 Tax=Accumulibacter sp. TaxID=2053492 RepID=UPI0035B4A4F1
MLQGFGLEFHHLGLATRDADKTLAFLRGLGYHTPESVHDPLQRVKLALCEHLVMPAVEVIFATNEAGPLDLILAHQPQSIYHLCFRSRDLVASLAAIKAAGHRTMVVSPPTPAVLFHGRPVSFHMMRGFGLVEIIEDTS